MARTRHFPAEEYHQRLTRVRAKMAKDGLDGCLIASPENICYLTGLDHQGYFAYQLLVVPPEGQPLLITRPSDGSCISARRPSDPERSRTFVAKHWKASSRQSRQASRRVKSIRPGKRRSIVPDSNTIAATIAAIRSDLAFHPVGPAAACPLDCGLDPIWNYNPAWYSIYFLGCYGPDAATPSCPTA